MNNMIKTNKTKILSSRSLSLCVLASVVLCSVASVAQRVAPTVRIVSPIDESQRVSLSGNINPLANAQNDRGPVDASTPMTGLVMVLNRSLEQQAAFDSFVAGEYDPSSPNFHQWLTPQQIGAQYGPAPADIAAITGWLTSRGFAVKSVSPDGMSIGFSGTAGQAQAAFHTQIHNLLVNGEKHIANMSDPQIPAALAPVVIGVKGLHNFLPRPLHRVGSKVQFSPDAHGWVKLQPSSGAGFSAPPLSIRTPSASANSASPRSPNYYFSYTGGSVEEDVSPYDFAKIYNLPSAWPTSANGAGQIITVLGTSDINLGDVTSFRSAFGLPAGPALITAHGPDGDPGDCGSNPSTDACGDSDLEENSLDVEWSGGVAPGAQVVLVTDAYNSQSAPTNDPIYDDAQWAIANAFVAGSQVYGTRILSSSYGLCELVNTTATNVAYNNLWQTAYAAGIAVFVASGDGGAATCDFTLGGDSIGNPYEAQFGTTVNGNASTPYNTAVGGTDFSWCQPTINSSGNVVGCSSTNASAYWNTSNSSQQSSAKTYVPETPWNDTCENPLNAAYLESVAAYFAANGVNLGTFSTPEESCSFAYSDYGTVFEDAGAMIAPLVDTIGGGGGASSCVVNSSPSIYGATYSGPGTCSSSATSTGSLTLVNDGWPKPSWQTGVTGIPADGVRDLPDVSFFAGNGGFASASLVCVSNDGATCSNIGDTQCLNAGTCTGGAEEIGGTSVATPEMAGVMALINENAGAPQGNPNAVLYTLAAKQTYSECSAEGPPSSSCYFNSIDQGTNAQPCAVSSLDLEGGAVYDSETGEWEPGPTEAALASPNCSIVNSGDVIGTLAGFKAATGYNQANGLGSLNVANVINAGVWTATSGTKAATIAINLGGVTSISESQSLTVTVTVSGASGTPTGTVALTATNSSEYSSEQVLSGGTATFTIPANTFTSTGTATLTATYSGSSTYATSSKTATITITGGTAPPTGTFTLAAITSPAAVAPGATATTTATVSSSNGYAGIVTLSCALTTEPSGATALPSCSPTGAITLSATVTSGNTTLSVTTTPSTVETSRIAPADGRGLFGAGGGALLALLVFFGIPARRRSWRALLGMVALLVTLGSLAACGGGGGGTTTTTIPGTTAGTYTFTVTPQGNPTPSSAAATQTFTVTVN
jgi:subtilase family serine protease